MWRLAVTQMCAFSFLQLSAITQTPLDRHLSCRRRQSMARWLEVGLGGQLFTCGWPHYPATRIRSATIILIKNIFGLNKVTASCHKKWGLANGDKCQCGKRETMFHIINSCPQTKPEDGQPRLIVPRTRLSTIGDRSFRVTVAQAWNSLPTNVTASTSLPSFKRQLKTFLFTKSFPSL